MFKEMIFAFSLALWLSEVHSATSPRETSSSQRADEVGDVCGQVWWVAFFLQLSFTLEAFGLSVLCLLLYLFQQPAASRHPSKDTATG